MTTSGWHEDYNAQCYEAYVQTYPMYRELAAKLVEVAALQPGMIVVDLACGTGIVTKYVLDAGIDKVIGIDLSEAMLEIARCKFPNVIFIRTPAAQLDQYIQEASIDVVVCSSALWQLQAQKTLAAVHRILKSQGRLVFNWPHASETAYFFEDLVRQIAVEEYGYKVPQTPSRPFPSPQEILSLVSDFTFSLRDELEIVHTLESSYAFNKLPVMSGNLLRGLDYETRLAIFEQAYQRSKKEDRHSVFWRYYVAEKSS